MVIVCAHQLQDNKEQNDSSLTELSLLKCSTWLHSVQIFKRFNSMVNYGVTCFCLLVSLSFLLWEQRDGFTSAICLSSGRAVPTLFLCCSLSVSLQLTQEERVKNILISLWRSRRLAAQDNKLICNDPWTMLMSPKKEKNHYYMYYLQTLNTSAGILTLFHCWVIHQKAVSNFPLQHTTSLSALTSLMSQSRCWKLCPSHFPGTVCSVSGLFSDSSSLHIYTSSSSLTWECPSTTSAFYCCPLKWLAFLLWHLQALWLLCLCRRGKTQQNIILQLKTTFKDTFFFCLFFFGEECFEGIKIFYFINYQLLGRILNEISSCHVKPSVWQRPELKMWDFSLTPPLRRPDLTIVCHLVFHTSPDNGAAQQSWPSSRVLGSRASGFPKASQR